MGANQRERGGREGGMGEEKRVSVIEGKWMSAAISGAAGALTDTHSRWMTLIWEITECALTPGPRLRRATITPDRRIGLPPPNQPITLHIQYARGGGGMHAHTYTHTHARTHNHLTEQIAAPVLPSCLLTLKFTWSLVSQGCARRGREKKKGG